MLKDNPAKPLDGFRVLDFTQNVAGPLAGQVLADLGAEVIKVEAPGGEAARQITAVLPGRPPLATYFLPNNRGKKSVAVDLTNDAARQQIVRLADTADVVLEGFRPGVMERMGLGPDDLRSRNPKLIYARLSAFGGNGPHGTRPGVDLMVAAEAGMTTGMPTPDGKPQIIPFQLVDNASGHVLAQAVLAALLNRERHGVADTVRVAMYDVAVGLQANQLTMHLNRRSDDRPKPEEAPTGKRRKRVGFATQPSDAFRAADGYLLISAYVPKHWHKLCHIIGRPDLLDDERFIDQRARAVNYPELTEELESALAARTAAEWVELLHEGGLMACLAYTWKQVVETPLFAENDLALPVGSGEHAVTVIRTPARYASFRAVLADPPPAPGQHNDLFLTES
ncbi:Succinyl-CoA:(R)-benzylsuccinate CoA-transferase subunit BbsF [Mycobacterium basiliense]|uniref:Succinyl-CoA:(R)-benzylsuccinate CoA-transferase subunit BbsF n=1 Tax=Mycobacterium basiliense TaxID=2094119 RepID=A0A3S4CTU8_9MYCO|nr:CoA transferase [Mycobacterium basiliense]VDM87616.1 Succinyl-CoA:(R)-benzylsuccinate CoA-transferase subunit BbsF [Mycobacterium basiliense]